MSTSCNTSSGLVKGDQPVSANPLTGKQYPIPTKIDDRDKIEQFLQLNQGKPVVVVQGLGFVGAVMSVVVANALTEEYAVIGVDLPSEASYWKIQVINEGVFPVVSSDPKVEEFYNKAKGKGNLLATCDPFCYSVADVIVVDISLDVQKESGDAGKLQSYDVDLSGFKAAMRAIGDRCKEDSLLLVETTVPPGTCEKVVTPIIRAGLEKRGKSTDKIMIGHSYERVMPGPEYINSIQNFYRVFSGIDEKSEAAAEAFLRTIIRTDEYPLTKLKNTNSTEMAKVLENSYRAMNIAFIVEWSRFAEEAGVDLYEVVDAIRMRPTHSNMMFPGIGVGGYCLTKDPLLASWAKKNLFESDSGLPQSETGVEINDQMPKFAFDYLVKRYGKNLSGKKVLMLGVSYRSDVGDTRYTPVELLYECLKQAGCVISLHDPYVQFWEEQNLDIEQDVQKLLENQQDIIIYCTSHSSYKDNVQMLESIKGQGQLLVYDTIGILSVEEITSLREKHAVVVLGRGDI